tara:strand:- start:15732 stop:17186 length:1455 start_codon:yes stop_codon:yes gene_type:complete
MKERLLKIVEKFKEKTILVVGDIILDKYVMGNVERTSPEAPIPIVEVKKENFVPGGAGNAANNLSSLGAKVYLSGVIGDDIYGEVLIKILQNLNIKTDLIIKDLNKRTIVKERVVAQNQQLVRVDYENKEKINDLTENNILNNVRSIITNIDGIVVSDYGKGLITKKLMDNIITLCKEHNKIIVVDPKPENKDFYYGVNLITPNYLESTMMTNIFGNEEENLNIIGEKLKEISKSVLITRGSKGMTLFDDDIKYFPTKAKGVYDVSGAGDSVVTTITLSLTCGAAMEEAVTIANYVAGIVVSKFGTSTTNILEIEEAIEEKNKIKTRETITKTVNELKKQNKKIVTINGSFDVLHRGHLHILEEAKKQGDILIIGLNSDSSVKEWRKSIGDQNWENRPINDEKHRAELLSGLSCVDYITIFDETTCIEFIESIKPNVHVNGSEYGKDCIEAETVKKHNGIIHIVEDIEKDKLSSSSIIKKMKNE